MKRYNSKLKLLRVTGTVLKFVNLLKSKKRTEVSKDLNGEELRGAENLWIRDGELFNYHDNRYFNGNN